MHSMRPEHAARFMHESAMSSNIHTVSSVNLGVLSNLNRSQYDRPSKRFKASGQQRETFVSALPQADKVPSKFH